MNDFQKLWWRQAQSDHAVLVFLRRNGIPPCHQLHYLQMVTEKLGKAYFWRSGNPPPRSHAGFTQFLRFLGQVKSSERQHLAGIFAFGRFDDFQSWIRAVLPLAYDLERLVPKLAQDNGPNPEYPWPHNAPQHTPATYEFEIWKKLTETGQGRRLLQVIATAVDKFPDYG